MINTTKAQLDIQNEIRELTYVLEVYGPMLTDTRMDCICQRIEFLKKSIA